MKRVKLIPLLLSKDEVEGVVLAIERHLGFLRNCQAVKPGADSQDIEVQILRGITGISNEPLLSKVAKRFGAVKLGPSANLIHVTPREFEQLSLAVGWVASLSQQAVRAGAGPTSPRELQESGRFFTLARTFDRLGEQMML